MKKSKLIAVFLVVCLLLTMAAGCGKTGSSSGNTGNSTPAATPAAGGDAAAPSHKSPDGGAAAKTEVLRLINEDRVQCLNGLQPESYEDRSDVYKALPVTQKNVLSLGMDMGTLSSAYFQTMLATVQAECEKYGWTVEYQVANFTQETANAQMEAFISKGVDCIIANCDVPSTLPIFDKSVAAGIPVICLSNQLALRDYPILTEILTSSYQAGWEVGVYTAQQTHKTGVTPKIGLVEANLGTGDTDSRSCGFLGGYYYTAAKMDGDPYDSMWDCILEYYYVWQDIETKGKYSDESRGIDVVGYGNGETPDVAGGQKSAQDLIVAHPDVDILQVETDTMYPGVKVVLDQNGLVPGKDVIIACTADGTKEGMDALKAGEILVIGNNSPAVCALGAMDMIHAIFTENYDANNLVANSFMPTTAITKENIDEYYDPNSALAKGISGKFWTIPEYNEAHKGADGSAVDPF
jgi:ABC-type sugar transport system substrate-binding protein